MRRYAGSCLLLRTTLGKPPMAFQLPELQASGHAAHAAGGAHHPDGRVVLTTFPTFDLLATYAPKAR